MSLSVMLSTALTPPYGPLSSRTHLLLLSGIIGPITVGAWFSWAGSRGKILVESIEPHDFLSSRLLNCYIFRAPVVAINLTYVVSAPVILASISYSI